MDRTALKLAAEMLEKAAERFGRHTCNDLELPATPENLALVQAAHKWAHAPSTDYPEPQVHEGNVQTVDWLLMGYLAHLLADAALKRRC